MNDMLKTILDGAVAAISPAAGFAVYGAMKKGRGTDLKAATAAGVTTVVAAIAASYLQSTLKEKGYLSGLTMERVGMLPQMRTRTNFNRDFAGMRGLEMQVAGCGPYGCY